MNEQYKQHWPKLPSGNTDWETAFEDPENGLIALVSQAKTVGALRDCMIMIIKRFYTKDDDPVMRKQFANAISKILADGSSDNLLPKSIHSITALLREIKIERLKNSDTHLPIKNVAKSFDHQVDQEDAQPKISVRHQRSKTRQRELRAQSQNRKWKLTCIVGTALAASIALVIIFGGSDKKVLPVKQFIEQLTKVAGGDAINQHIYGGYIKMGTQGGRRYVLANNIPQKACASAAWVLGQRGATVINAVMPPRVTPTVLKKLCGKNGEHATIHWYAKLAGGKLAKP